MGKSVRDLIRKRAKEAVAKQTVGPLKVKYNEDDFFSPRTTNSGMVFDIIGYEVTSDNHPEGAEPGMIYHRRPFKLHVLTIDGKYRSFVCLRSIGKPCPICELYATLLKNGVDPDEVKDLKARDRELYNILPEGSKKVLLWEVAYNNFGAQLDKEMADDFIAEKYVDFFLPDKGHSLRVRFDKESFMGRPFKKANRIDFLEREKAIPKSALATAYSLDEVLNVLSYEALERVLYDCDSDYVQDAMEEQKEEKKKPAPKKDKVKKGPEKGPEQEPEPEQEESTVETEDDIDDTNFKDTRVIDVEPEHDIHTEEMAEEEEGVTEDQIKEMKRADLIKVIKEYELPINPKQFRKVEDLREAVLDNLDFEEEGSEEEGDDTCPHGFEFGTDHGRYDECEECEMWSECDDKREEIMEE